MQRRSQRPRDQSTEDKRVTGAGSRQSKSLSGLPTYRPSSWVRAPPELPASSSPLSRGAQIAGHKPMTDIRRSCVFRLTYDPLHHAFCHSECFGRSSRAQFCMLGHHGPARPASSRPCSPTSLPRAGSGSTWAEIIASPPGSRRPAGFSLLGFFLSQLSYVISPYRQAL